MGDFHSPPSTLMKASPLAPTLLATSSRALSSPWVRSASPFALIAFTAPPEATADWKTLNADALNVSEKSFELEPEPQVGLVHPEAVHRLGVGHPGETASAMSVAEDVLPELLQHALEQRVDVLAVDERRLDVDLGELHLAVGAQVLVAEAAGDLEIPLHPGDHEDLLELLGRLGEGVELARVDARGHEVLARALGRALEEDRRLDLDEVLRVEVVADRLRRPVPDRQVAAHLRPAQVEVAVGEPQVLVHLVAPRVVERERAASPRRSGSRARVASTSTSPVGMRGVHGALGPRRRPCPRRSPPTRA